MFFTCVSCHSQSCRWDIVGRWRNGRRFTAIFLLLSVDFRFKKSSPNVSNHNRQNAYFLLNPKVFSLFPHFSLFLSFFFFVTFIRWISNFFTILFCSFTFIFFNLFFSFNLLPFSFLPFFPSYLLGLFVNVSTGFRFSFHHITLVYFLWFFKTFSL